MNKSLLEIKYFSLQICFIGVEQKTDEPLIVTSESVIRDPVREAKLVDVLPVVDSNNVS